MLGGNLYDMGHDAMCADDGNIIVIGAVTNQGENAADVYLSKLNPEGEILWEKSFGTNYEDGGNEIISNHNGYYFVAGHVDRTGSSLCDALFFLINENGDTLWTRSFGNDEDDAGYGCVLADDGGFISIGKFEEGGNSNGFIAKHNIDGDLVWSQIYGNEKMDYFTSIINTETEYLIGGKKTFLNNSDFWLMKINESGEILWEETYDNGLQDLAYDVEEDADGGFLLAGKIEGETSGSSQVYLVKTDINGLNIWEAKYGNNFGDMATSVVYDNGKWMVTGTFYNLNNHSQDIGLMQLNNNGEIEWIKYFGDAFNDTGRRIHLNAEGGWLICGTAETPTPGNQDIYLVKTNMEGEVASSLNNQNTGVALSVNPNPFIDKAIFTCTNTGDDLQFSLVDINGKQIINIPAINSQVFEVDTKMLTAGIYFYLFKDSSSNRFNTGKLIVNK